MGPDLWNQLTVEAAGKPWQLQKNKKGWTKGISTEAITSMKSGYLIFVNLTLKRKTLQCSGNTNTS